MLDVGFLQRWTEVGRQSGLSFRQSGFFNGVSSTITIDPRNYVPVTLRNVASDANNTYKLDLGAVFIQDQVEITRYLELIGGLRFDHFDLTSRDRRTLVELNRVDDLGSPRAGVVFKPLENLSIYGSYSVSYLYLFQTENVLYGTSPTRLPATMVAELLLVDPRIRVSIASGDLSGVRHVTGQGSFEAAGLGRSAQDKARGCWDRQSADWYDPDRRRP